MMLEASNRLTLVTELVSASRDAMTNLEKCIVNFVASDFLFSVENEEYKKRVKRN